MRILRDQRLHKFENPIDWLSVLSLSFAVSSIMWR